MKRAVFPIVVVLCTVTSIVAAFLAGRTAIPNTLYTTQADLHLGESFQGQTLEFAYELNNGSNVPVKIVDVEAGCTCTTGKPEKAILQPGESTLLRTTWKIGPGKRGMQEERVFVFFVPDGQAVSPRSPAKIIQLAVRTNVVPDFAVTPERLEFDAGRQSTQTLPVTLQSRAGISADVLGATTTHRAFSASLVGKLSFAVTFDPAAWDGERRPVEIVFHSDSANEPEIRIPVAVR